MTFYVYPDNATAALLGKPPGAPIALANGKAMAGFAPLQPIFGNDPADNLSTSFISIAMNGRRPPRRYRFKSKPATRPRARRERP